MRFRAFPDCPPARAPRNLPNMPVPRPHAIDAEPATVDAIVESLRRQIGVQSRGRLTPEDVDPDVHVYEYGYLDSLSYVEFLLHVETTWGVRVGDVQFVSRFNTVRALAAHLASARSGAAA